MAHSTSGKPTPLQFVQRYTIADALAQCTAAGWGTRLRSSKPPARGISSYVWRMARFRSNEDKHMPFAATWDMQDEIVRVCGVKLTFGVLSTTEKAILDHLDGVVTELLARIAAYHAPIDTRNLVSVVLDD